jgi:hypothetical protein
MLIEKQFDKNYKEDRDQISYLKSMMEPSQPSEKEEQK